MQPNYRFAADYANYCDGKDPLRRFRDQFYIPQHDDKDVAYFCGNSLGLQPRATEAAIVAELRHWQRYGVEGHFEGAMPWKDYHHYLKPATAAIVGALEHEVTVMNTLTTNLHLLMASFYRPTPKRFKIVMEARAFPSDQYAMETQVRWHGFDPASAIIEIAPREGEHTLRTDDILQVIENEGDSVALVMFGGVNYYTGQCFDMARITEAGHRIGAIVGFDLAHAAGNIRLHLHDWGVDFAAWCSYKYLNAGPGGPSGIFVHERWADAPELPRLAGWWGHNEAERFKMEKGFQPMYGADGWQCSNAQIFSFAAYKVSTDLHIAAGLEALTEKARALSGYLHWLIGQINLEKQRFTVITPSLAADRGCQVSILTGSEGRKLFDYLTTHGVITDWREPNVIRVAPVPLYNTFSDVLRLATLLRDF